MVISNIQVLPKVKWHQGRQTINKRQVKCSADKAIDNINIT